jgi:hypothetical protein
MNRHDRRSLKRGTMEIKMLPVDKFNKLTARACCFNGCGNSFDFKDGGMPKGWQAIVMYGDPQTVLHLGEVRDWKRDGVLCPEHAEVVQDLMFPLTHVGTMPSEGTA